MKNLQGGFKKVKRTHLIFGHTEFVMPAEMWVRNSGDLSDLKNGGIIKDSGILRKVGTGTGRKVLLRTKLGVLMI